MKQMEKKKQVSPKFQQECWQVFIFYKKNYFTSRFILSIIKRDLNDTSASYVLFKGLGYTGFTNISGFDLYKQQLNTLMDFIQTFHIHLFCDIYFPVLKNFFIYLGSSAPRPGYPQVPSYEPMDTTTTQVGPELPPRLRAQYLDISSDPEIELVRAEKV